MRRTARQTTKVRILNTYGNEETITLKAKSHSGMAAKIRNLDEAGKLVRIISHE